MSRSVTLKVAFGGRQAALPRGASRPETGAAGPVRERVGEVEAKPNAPHPGRVPRIARLMALAIRMDGLIRSGAVKDQSDAAELAHVTRARITQIMNLLHLDPAIQEEVLFLPPVFQGDDPITEHQMRPIAAEILWDRQRTMFRKLRGSPTPSAY